MTTRFSETSHLTRVKIDVSLKLYFQPSPVFCGYFMNIFTKPQ